MQDAGLADDSSIPDEVELWRRIPPTHVHLDKNLGQQRPASWAFSDDEDGEPMSVVIARPGRDPRTVLEGHPSYALAAVTAGLVRECGLRITRQPLDEEPDHAVVSGRKTDGVRRRLAKGSTWVVPPLSPSP